MRTVLVFLFLLILVISCNSSNDKSVTVKESIVFSARPVKTQSLYAKPTLTAEFKKQQLELNLELKCLTHEKLIVTEIVLSNPSGLNSYPNNIQVKKLPIPNTHDTTLSLTFNHIHDKKLFQATGLPGMIDSVYQLSVFFVLEGSEDIRKMDLDFKISKELFLSYQKLFNPNIQIYNFNTANGFEERQKEYLLKEKIINTSPFVHISDQEIAVSGLNYRVKCFHKQDSLYAEIFIVNHSDLTIRLDPTNINLVTDRDPNTTAIQDLKINKVTGSKQDRDILRKGDRIICTLRKYIPNSPVKIQLTVNNSFFLASGKKLFVEDLELMLTNYKNLNQ